MKKVCVMGAGTMGLDVAQVFATKGFEVTVRDISDEILDAAKAKLIKGLDKKVAKGKMTEEAKEAILGNMSFTTDLKALADMDLIVEAILERMDIKKSVFGELDTICKPETILRPTPLLCPSPRSLRRPSVRTSSSACTSLTPQRL